MAKAKKCDRCGKFYTDRLNNKIKITYEDTDGEKSSRTMELCPECMQKLRKFISNPSINAV